MKVFVKTFGCAFNQRDSENICGVLIDEGFEIVDSIDGADVVVVNSCGVKSITQNRVISFIDSVPEGKKVFVGGCLPRMRDLRKLSSHIDAVFDTNTILSLPKILKKPADLKSDIKEDRINAPIKRSKEGVAIIPICQGCVGECSYCSVRFARGPLKSYTKNNIIKEVKRSVASGCRRINLTAQDTGCWGMDIGDSLPGLLEAVLAVDGDFIVRLGMANPNFVNKHLKELIRLFKSGKMLKFLHVPVQSGSDKVLKEMKRKYSVGDFRRVVVAFRKEIPGICISTDVIAGYPSETEEDFQETVRLLKEVRPEIVNISKFGPRPGTPAAKLRQISTKEIKRRSVLLHGLVKVSACD